VAGTDGGIYYSADGKTWSLGDIASSINIIDVQYAHGLWVAVGKGAYYSTDGKTWTEILNGAYIFSCVHNANGIWIISSPDGAGTWYSTNGRNWNMSTGVNGFSAIHYAHGVWVGGSHSALYYSADGKMWSPSNITVGYNISKIHNANGIWVATTYDPTLQPVYSISKTIT